MKAPVLWCAAIFTAVFPQFLFSVESSSEPETSVTPTAPPVTESKVFTDSREQLRLYEFGSEQTVVSPRTGGISSRVLADNERIVHTAYDNRMRPTKKLIWTVAQDTEKPSVTVEYLYENETDAVPQKTVQTDTGAKLKTEIWYSPDYLPVKEVVSSLVTTDETVETPVNQTKTPVQQSPILTESEWTYDSKKRITGETKRSGDHTSVKTFLYTDVSESPDTQLHENGVLKEEVIYRSKTRREETVYFSTESFVRIEYENEKKITETFEINGKKVRETHFE